MEKLLLKPAEAAQLLGIGRSLMYELIARNEIPSIRVGRCIRVHKTSLEKWISNRETVGAVAVAGSPAPHGQ